MKYSKPVAEYEINFNTARMRQQALLIGKKKYRQMTMRQFGKSIDRILSNTPPYGTEINQ